MGLFGFRKKYTEDDLHREVSKLRNLYLQAIGAQSTNKSRYELKRELFYQLKEVVTISDSGDICNNPTIEWPTAGCFMPLYNAVPVVQVLIETM